MAVRRIVVTAALVWIFAVAAPAQDDAGRILAAMRQASGGDAWNTVISLHYQTAIVSDGQQARGDHWEDVITGRYVVRAVTPSYARLDGFDGLTPWTQGLSGIPYTLGDVDGALVAADESFRVSRSWWFRDRHPATIAFVGTRAENGRSFDVLEITPEGGRPFQAWIDQTTHLLARTDEQQAEDHVITDYSDYRTVQGLVLPFAIKTEDTLETVQSVEVNQPVPNELYDIPPNPPSDIALPAHRDRVEVPFRLSGDNRILVPVTIDGRRRVDAEFDSGGSLILQPSLVASLHLAASGQAKQSGGGEGSTIATRGRVTSIAIGGAVVRQPMFHSFAFNPDSPDLALVGQEILQRFVVTFDFDRRIMTLARPEAFVYRGKGKIVPFHFQDNQPEVKGSIDGIAGLFAIDTGDSSSLLLIAPFARHHNLVERYQADLPYDGKAISATHGMWARKRVHTVSFDGPDGRPLVEVHDPVTRISLQQSGFDANRDVSANIGLGILRQFNLTFDYPHQRLILVPNREYDSKDVFNRTGLVLARRDNVWSVTTVYPGSPAADAGLKSGDVLTAINGKPAGEFDRGTLWGMMKAAVGSKLRLQVRSDGTERAVTLSLRDIL